MYPANASVPLKLQLQFTQPQQPHGKFATDRNNLLLIEILKDESITQVDKNGATFCASNDLYVFEQLTASGLTVNFQFTQIDSSKNSHKSQKKSKRKPQSEFSIQIAVYWSFTSILMRNNSKNHRKNKGRAVKRNSNTHVFPLRT